MIVAPRVVVSGLAFPEGPVYAGDGTVVVTEIRGQRLTRCSDRGTERIAEPGGGPNGAAVSGDGAIWIANNGGLSLGPGGYWFAPEFGNGRIQRVATGGAVQDFTDLPGDRPHRPNDLCFGPDGGLYFTDPRNWEDLANLKLGRVWRFDPATGTAEPVAELPHFPNGIGFGADGRLYVAQSNVMKLVAFEWSFGGLGEPREFATLPRGFPDGFCFAANGDAYVCGSLGDVIQIFDAEGALKDTIEFPEHTEPTNCCLGDGVLYVTCSGTGRVLAFDLGVEALPLFPFRN